MPSQPYDIQYAAEAAADLRAMRSFDQRIVLEGIELHLLYQSALCQQEPNQTHDTAILKPISAPDR